MLTHPTLEKLHTLKLTGMARAFTQQLTTPDIEGLGFEERLGLLVDRELTERENRRLTTRLKKARLRQSATLEDLDTRTPRGLDKGLLAQLGAGQWLAEHLNVLICRPSSRAMVPTRHCSTWKQRKIFASSSAAIAKAVSSGIRPASASPARCWSSPRVTAWHPWSRCSRCQR